MIVKFWGFKTLTATLERRYSPKAEAEAQNPISKMPKPNPTDDIALGYKNSKISLVGIVYNTMASIPAPNIVFIIFRQDEIIVPVGCCTI